MPAVVNAAASLLFGASMAFAARRSDAMRRDAMSWPLLFVVGFQGIVVAPVAAYLFRFHPQWSMLYWFDPQILPDLNRWLGWLSALAVCANVGAAVLGYAVARAGIVADHAATRLAPLVVGGAAMVAIFLAYGDRVAFIGDYDAFWQGSAVIFFKRLPGWIGISLYLGAFLFVLWTYSRYRGRDPTLV